MRRPETERPGAAAVELAVLLPFLLFFALIATDWARMIYYTVALDSVARTGAMYAADSVAQQQSPYYDSSKTVGYCTAVAALAEAPNLSPQPTVSDPVYSAADASGNKTVTVTATLTFNTVSGLNVPPLFSIPSTQQVTRSVTMRVAPTSFR